MKFNITNKILKKKFYIDSRLVKENSVFLCIKGPNNDGHKYAKLVLDRFKRTIIICEKNSIYLKNLKNSNRVIFCNSTKDFLINLARIKRYLLNSKNFIGITGSSGKTSLKDLLFTVLNKYKKSYKSQKSYNNNIGLPYTLVNQNINSEFNIYELGMNNFGEIDSLSNILKPNLAIITNIGEAHLGNLGSIKNIAKAKAEIIKNITKQGTIILNHDCKFFNQLKKISKKNKIKVLSFGSTSKATVSYKVISLNEIEIKLNNLKFKLKLNDINPNMINNMLVCILVLSFFKLNIRKSKNYFNKIKNTRGRGNIVKFRKEIIIIDDSYNSNPSSLKSSINQFEKLSTKKKKILVIGDMLELGKFSKKKHGEIGNYLSKMGFNRILLVGKDSKEIYKKIKSTFWCKYFENINIFSKYFKNVLIENSIIMFKASNGVGLNKLLNKKIY
ncbi:UDP-N-acetylmuramoyl-tripeptide--D-alanyl-D-alanine ligase [alpha proteobacterium HIMB114]|nr:UDP-N-acetylmuramoyl-tripeptide--D-alanyl-D-alanine ligase [alpha proteobacterium HIMB114]